MRAVIQRVKNSSVEVDGKIVGKIGNGLMLLLGVLEGDTEKEADKLAEKIVNLRIFCDEDDKMNLSLLDICGELLVVSQFTLCADCRKGRRPGFDKSAKPDTADKLYEYFKSKCSSLGVKKVESGMFGADMKVSILNDGPVTFVIDCVNGELL